MKEDRKLFVILFTVIIVFCCAFEIKSTSTMGTGNIPKDGFVPNAKTAIKVAEPILDSIYGEDKIRKEKPLNAELDNNVWIIRGVLHSPKGHVAVGGVAEIHISKKDCRVLFVSHGK